MEKSGRGRLVEVSGGGERRGREGKRIREVGEEKREGKGRKKGGRKGVSRGNRETEGKGERER